MKLPSLDEVGKCIPRSAHLVLSSSLALGVLILVSMFLNDIPKVLGNDHAATQPALTAHAVAPLRAVSGPDTYTNCRFGSGQVYRSVLSYNLTSLNLGWYLNWGTQVNPPRPEGMTYVHTLRVSDGATFGGREHPGPRSYFPSGSTLETIIAANPGALWLVGNEADCIWQDNVLPQNYAQIYHDAHTFIKGRDPTARVAVGGIVQPTPLRMEYLETVLDTYASLYGESLPTDAWHIHSFILREVNRTVYPDSWWGCEIPPGSTAAHGMLYELDQTDNLDIFEQRIIQFRQWMRDRGYRNKPLLITEYGTLMPHQYEGWDEERGRVFMYGTFDFLLTASDPSTGYPADEDRLVQRWLWYSLDNDSYGGTLFNRFTLNPLPMGIYFGDYTSIMPPTADLLAVEVRQARPIPYSPTSTAAITLEARVSNVGNTSITRPVTLRFLDSAEQQIGDDQVISETIAGCADIRSVTVVWPDVAPGAHSVQIVIDPADVISETNEENNKAYGIVLVAKEQVLLPLVSRNK